MNEPENEQSDAVESVFHTPGPWRHEKQINPHGIVKRAMVFAGNQEIALLVKTRSPGEASANSQLMSAAPDMLEALRAAMNCIGELSPTIARVEAMLAIQDAIESATGPPDFDEGL